MQNSYQTHSNIDGPLEHSSSVTNGQKHIGLPGLVHEILGELGEDSARPGLVRTPDRVARSLQFLTRGYSQNPQEVLNQALFATELDEMVVVRNIEFCSLCEHHMLPFFGSCDIAYIPDGHIVGLSKLGRVVDIFARRLQVQERLVSQVAEAVNAALKPKGVGVIMRAQHLCMIARGVQKQKSETVTSAMLGLFRDRQSTRNEFLSIVRE